MAKSLYLSPVTDALVGSVMLAVSAESSVAVPPVAPAEEPSSLFASSKTDDQLFKL